MDSAALATTVANRHGEPTDASQETPQEAKHETLHEVTLHEVALHETPDSSQTATSLPLGAPVSRAPVFPISRASRASLGTSAHAPHVLSEREEAILYAIARLHWLTAEQVTHLFYRRGSLEFVRAMLKRLTVTGYLARLRLPRATPGNAPWVYALARRGLATLQGTHDTMQDAGLPPLNRFRPAEQAEKSYLFLTHTLRVNDFLIAALLLPHRMPQVALADWKHERELRRSPVHLRTARGELQTVIPDAWLDFSLAGRARMSLLLELDRGTIEQQAFMRKVRGLLALAAGPYAATFGTTSLTLVFATTAGPTHAERIVTWCEQTLRSLHQEATASLFLIGALPPGALDPLEVFLAPRWTQPFVQQPTPLLDLAAATRFA